MKLNILNHINLCWTVSKTKLTDLDGLRLLRIFNFRN